MESVLLEFEIDVNSLEYILHILQYTLEFDNIFRNIIKYKISPLGLPSRSVSETALV